MPKCLKCCTHVVSAMVICDECFDDLVEAVRCGKCKYARRTNVTLWCSLTSGLDFDVKETDFCSRGVRK